MMNFEVSRRRMQFVYLSRIAAHLFCKTWAKQKQHKEHIIMCNMEAYSILYDPMKIWVVLMSLGGMRS